ncbi:uncharacterized protein BDW43DRAFT_316401 [Aspergillus alliaceus]|uniref:uncharacterized protein n=1 Tax=Petromyces alliaceus TaxID=209559 RepID=UPI0012A51B83|nr:uncharacterized protein BDW43DRAFT_316401 [Aspergillus alliaceus]KAB8227889.1 hypothetical protein BDW43DRAFT_316401 [Aspergillus alliaceus]
MSNDYTRDTEMLVRSIEENVDEVIDIQTTDSESESEYSATKSDIDFIDTQDDFIGMEDHEQSYVPTDTDEMSSLISSDDATTSQLNSIGDYGEISVLDEREIEGEDGPVTLLLINGWLEENIANQVIDIVRLSNRGY